MMEVKHSHNFHFSLSLPHLTTSTHFQCCYFKPWINGKLSFKKHCSGLAELWRFHILEMSKPDAQSSKKHHTPNVIKEAETLNSILRQYGECVNLTGMSADLVLKCQLLKIPTFSSNENQLIKKTGFHSYQKEDSAAIFDGYSKEKPFIMLTAHGLPHVKSTGYFLVLVPLIAFCVTCIIGAFRSRVPTDKRREDFDESRRHHNQPKSVRWKHALSNINEPDNLNYANTSEDEDPNICEDMSDAYSRVENDYQKFLSEWGYWRGGIHE